MKITCFRLLLLIPTFAGSIRVAGQGKVPKYLKPDYKYEKYLGAGVPKVTDRAIIFRAYDIYSRGLISFGYQQKLSEKKIFEGSAGFGPMKPLQNNRELYLIYPDFYYSDREGSFEVPENRRDRQLAEVKAMFIHNWLGEPVTNIFGWGVFAEYALYRTYWQSDLNLKPSTHSVLGTGLLLTWQTMLSDKIGFSYVSTASIFGRHSDRNLPMLPAFGNPNGPKTINQSGFQLSVFRSTQLNLRYFLY